MTKGRVALLVVAAMVFLSVGFVIGQIVQAAGTVPGSAGDPLVAQSYVEKVVGETVADLESKLDEMDSKVTALQERIDELSKDTRKVSSGSSSSGNSGSNSGSSSGAAKPDNNSKSSAQGKTVAVSGTSANVRSGPGTTYDKVASLVSGDTATVILEENSWYKVTLSDGQEGWIANWLVEVK